MWEMIEQMASNRLWIYTALVGSLFGLAFSTYFDVEGNVKEGYSRWYMIKQWFKGTGKGLLKGKVDGFSDHSMGGYHELCKKAGK